MCLAWSGLASIADQLQQVQNAQAEMLDELRDLQIQQRQVQDSQSQILALISEWSTPWK